MSPQAKDQELTAQQRDDLDLAARHAVAQMKETKHATTGELILGVKASYDLDYVAAAFALLCGWFAKGNGEPNPTVAASKLRSPDAPAPSSKVAASTKAWMQRLQDVDDALKARASQLWRVRKERREAEAIAVLRLGIGPRTVLPPNSRVAGEFCMQELQRFVRESGKLDSMTIESCGYPVCSGACDGARRQLDRPTFGGRYVCTCMHDMPS